MSKIRKDILSVCLLGIAVWLSGCSAPYPRFTSEDYNKNVSEEKTEDNVIVETRIESIPKEETNPDFDGGRMMDVINKRVGIPYRYGGKDDSGFDCSGFSSFIYEKSARIKLGASSVDQYKQGKNIEKHELKFGDLVFFNTTGRIPSHVGIYVGSDRFAHASVQKGVTISSLNSTYYKKRFVGARRVIFR